MSPCLPPTRSSLFFTGAPRQSPRARPDLITVGASAPQTAADTAAHCEVSACASNSPLLSGLLLAGGRGQRMGGCSKGLQPLLGQPLATAAHSILRANCAEVLLSANDDQARWQRVFDLTAISDIIGERTGPLAGLHAGLVHARHPLLLCLPCDTPLLPAELGQRLLNALLSEQADIAIARTPLRHHPLCCLCRRELASDLAQFLHAGERRVAAWQARQHTVEVLFADEDAFRNINTAAELAELETVLSSTLPKGPRSEDL